MSVILFIICLVASTLGAVAGFGGGVIIKPVLDALALLPVSTISFLSGCTVLAMSVSSLIRNRNDGVQLSLKTSTPLAIGAAFGGIVGKFLFELVRKNFGNESMLGFIQAVCLVSITIFVFIYICKKDSLKSMHIENLWTCLIIGTILGIISSFLGIGGGTSNVAMLFFFFSMDAKTAAKNSIYIIMFSQCASILNSIVQHTVPAFEWSHLIFMALGGVGGALIGAVLSKRFSNKSVEKLLRVLLLLIIGINFYNVIRFGIAAF